MRKARELIELTGYTYDELHSDTMKYLTNLINNKSFRSSTGINIKLRTLEAQEGVIIRAEADTGAEIDLKLGKLPY